MINVRFGNNSHHGMQNVLNKAQLAEWLDSPGWSPVPTYLRHSQAQNNGLAAPTSAHHPRYTVGTFLYEVGKTSATHRCARAREAEPGDSNPPVVTADRQVDPRLPVTLPRKAGVR
jgi:hypothetical protein